MSQDALGQLKHLKTARARWPFPDVTVITIMSSLVTVRTYDTVGIVRMFPNRAVMREIYVFGTRSLPWALNA